MGGTNVAYNNTASIPREATILNRQDISSAIGNLVNYLALFPRLREPVATDTGAALRDVDLQLGGDNFPGQSLNVGTRPRSGAGQPRIKRVNSQRLHEMKDFQFFFNGGVLH